MSRYFIPQDLEALLQFISKSVVLVMTQLEPLDPCLLSVVSSLLMPNEVADTDDPWLFFKRRKEPLPKLRNPPGNKGRCFVSASLLKPMLKNGRRFGTHAATMITFASTLVQWDQ